MAEIAGAEFQAALFAGETPATGILAAVAGDGTLKVLESWDPVQGDALHSAPAGSAGGGGTRRHLFDREVYVDSDGAGTYVNVRAFASITGKPTTVQGYGITNAVRTDLGATQNIDAAVTVAGAVTITTNAVYFTGKTAGAVAKRLIGVNAGGLVSIDVDAIGATFGAGVVVAGAITTGSDAANDLGSGSFRFRAGFFSGTVTATTFSGALSGNATTATTAGTVTTAAQPAITSVGTLTSLTVSGAVSLTSANATISATTAGTSEKYVRFASTAGNVYFGINDHANSFFTGAGADATAIYSPGNTVFVSHNGLTTKFDSTGLIPGTDNALDFGGSSNRWRDGYFSRTVKIGAATDPVKISNDSTYGVITFNSAASLTTGMSIGGRINGAEGLYYNTPTGTTHAFTVNGVAAASISATTFSAGIPTFTSGTTRTANFVATGTDVEVNIFASGATANTSRWGLYSSPAGIFAIRSLNDAYNAATSVVTFDHATSAAMFAGQVTVGNHAASTNGDLVLDGATTANFGPLIRLWRGGAAVGYIGTDSGINGGTSSDIAYFAVNNQLFQPGNGGTVAKITTGGILAGTDAAYDVGGSSNRWRDGYFSRNVTAGGQVITVGDTQGIFKVRNTATTDVVTLSTVKGWVGSGSVTDAALGSVAGLSIYSNGSTTASLTFAASQGVTFGGAVTMGNGLSMGNSAISNVTRINPTTGNGGVIISSPVIATTGNITLADIQTTGARLVIGIESSVGGTLTTGTTAYAAILTTFATSLELGANNTVYLGITGVAGTPGNASVGNLYVRNGTAPTGNPTGEYFLWAESGALKGRGTSGTVTTIGNADPHCPECGRDFVVEWTNELYGELRVCMWCLTNELAGKRYVDRKLFDGHEQHLAKHRRAAWAA